MKLYLVAALFIAGLVAVPCFAEEETANNDSPVVVVAGGSNDQAVDSEDQSNPPDAGTGDETSDEGETGEDVEADDVDKDDGSIPEELKDEVEQVKKRRVRHRLSRSCCLILKHYGQCRNNIIKQLCPNVCGHGCRNLLSHASCRAVRYTYKRCGHVIGRVYCKQTCGLCGVRPRWVCRRPYWCGHRNRRLLRYGLTAVQCQNYCLKHVRGCRAVESWYKHRRHCFLCKNPRLMKPYRNTRDLAYPPTVCYRVR